MSSTCQRSAQIVNADVLGTESTASAGLGLLVVSIATVLNSGR